MAMPEPERSEPVWPMAAQSELCLTLMIRASQSFFGDAGEDGGKDSFMLQAAKCTRHLLAKGRADSDDHFLACPWFGRANFCQFFQRCADLVGDKFKRRFAWGMRCISSQRPFSTR